MYRMVSLGHVCFSSQSSRSGFGSSSNSVPASSSLSDRGNRQQAISKSSSLFSRVTGKN
jgi:hypothetical protein